MSDQNDDNDEPDITIIPTTIVDPFTGDTYAIRECDAEDECVVLAKTLNGQTDECNDFHIPLHLMEAVTDAMLKARPQ